MKNTIPENLIIECAENIAQRKDIFYQIGQEYLKPLNDRELEETFYEIFQLILKNEKMWKGALLVPEYYRQDKVKNTFKDIWYTLKDYISWCILYPKEVDLYFKHNDSGKIEVLENPKLRIIDKDNIKQVYKSELGKKIMVPVKKERSFKIDSGFTLGQKDSILTVTVAGLLTLPDYLKKPKLKEEASEKLPVKKRKKKLPETKE